MSKAKTRLVLGASVAICLGAGCTTLRDVERELGRGGFKLWYPAEADVAAGQIWITNGEQYHPVCRCPPGLPLFGPHPAEFASLKKRINASATLKGEGTSDIMGSVGTFSATLAASGVREVTLSFGKTEITRVWLEDLDDTNVLKRLPIKYVQELDRVKRQDRGSVLLVGVVTASGMSYRLACTNALNLAGTLNAIASNLNVKADITIESEKVVTWAIPSTEKLVVGIAPLDGDLVGLTLTKLNAAVAATATRLRSISSEEILYRQLVAEGKVPEHVVKSGESLESIAKQCGVAVRQLRNANGLDLRAVRVGERLAIPRHE